MEFRYKLGIFLSFAAFFLPIIAFGLFGTYEEAAGTLATLLAGFYILAAIFVVGLVGTGIEWIVRYMLTRKGAG